ncbi:putative contactin-4 [Sesbania bispinosa]|nr:putative contactin-4 [Sesbania bispinosa]
MMSCTLEIVDKWRECSAVELDVVRGFWRSATNQHHGRRHGGEDDLKLESHEEKTGNKEDTRGVRLGGNEKEAVELGFLKRGKEEAEV